MHPSSRCRLASPRLLASLACSRIISPARGLSPVVLFAGGSDHGMGRPLSAVVGLRPHRVAVGHSVGGACLLGTHPPLPSSPPFPSPAKARPRRLSLLLLHCH